MPSFLSAIFWRAFTWVMTPLSVTALRSLLVSVPTAVDETEAARSATSVAKMAVSANNRFIKRFPPLQVFAQIDAAECSRFLAADREDRAG